MIMGIHGDTWANAIKNNLIGMGVGIKCAAANDVKITGVISIDLGKYETYL